MDARSSKVAPLGRGIPGMRSAWRGLWPAVPALLLAACTATVGADAPGDLPGASMVAPQRGCTLVSVSPAVALPPEGAGEPGSFRRRALLRHEADCLPSGSRPAASYQPYRIVFEQVFTESPDAIGERRWVSDETRFTDDTDQAPRALDGLRSGMGKNCAVLVEKIETETVPWRARQGPRRRGPAADSIGKFPVTRPTHG